MNEPSEESPPSHSQPHQLEAPSRREPEPTREFPFQFIGSAEGYFRIWIVNLCLTLLTLGVFSAWAKVRKKRYFYSHTILDGTPFQYLGEPIPILKGRVIAATAFFAYYTSRHFVPSALPYVLAIGMILAPWAIVRSAAFNARYSAFRNMTLHFEGTYLDTWRVIYLWGLLPLFAVGMFFKWWGDRAPAVLILLAFLAFPWWVRQFKAFIISRTSYGHQNGIFSAKGRQFFKIYFVAWLILFAAAILGLIVIVMLFGRDLSSRVALIAAVPIYAGYIAGYAYNQANSSNLVWNQTRLGPIRFRSTLSGRGMVELYLFNTVAILASLGLLIPWAVVRTLKYRLDNLHVLQEGDLTIFQGSETSRVHAVGTEVLEFFDLDVSL